MKLIGPLQGFVAVREQVEEYIPHRGIYQRDMVELVRSRYAFQAFPQLPPGALPPPILLFVGGQFLPSVDDRFGIYQIAMKEDGDVIVATTTEQADLVFDDLIKLLDENLGYRIRESQYTKHYLSNIVVEFDGSVGKYIAQLGKIAGAINDLRHGAPAFDIKRLAFGVGGVTETNDPLDSVLSADFIIERRAGAAYESNRYFCSAPIPTAEHLRLLAQIEAIMRGEA